MTLQQMLDAMNVKGSTLFIFKGKYGETFHCSLEFEGENGEAFKLRSADYSTALEGVTEVYDKFKSLTKTHFKDAVPAQLTYTKPEKPLKFNEDFSGSDIPF